MKVSPPAVSGAIRLLLVIYGIGLQPLTLSEANPLADNQQQFNGKGRYHQGSGSSVKSLSPNQLDGDNATPQRPPVFDRDDPNDVGGVQDVTTTLGQTAFLHCRVRYLGDRRVSWIRQKNLAILTSSLHTYSNDWRISAIHANVRDTTSTAAPNDNTKVDNGTTSRVAIRRPDGGSLENSTSWNDEEGLWSEWTLRIRATDSKDSGYYECQVSSEPKISKLYRLHVVVSKATILGSAELFVKKGSDINVTCVTVTEESSTAPQSISPLTPIHFTWYHNGQVLNYSSRGGGMSVTTDTIAGHSRLLLARASPPDSGNYTCVPGPGAAPASVTVHVLNGEQPAAMQRDNAASTVKSWSVTILGAVIHFCLVQRFNIT